MPVSDEPASPVPAAGVRANTGIMSAQAHSIDLPMLKNMLPPAELMISATARTVQTLARGRQSRARVPTRLQK